MLILLFSMLPLSAETVFLYLEDDWLTQDERRGAEWIAGGLADGVMERFFDAGFIIFNAENGFGTTGQPGNRRSSLLMAKSGGAHVLIEMKILYDQDGDIPVPYPRGVRFSARRVETDVSFLDDELLAEPFLAPPAQDEREVCRRLGFAAAGLVLDRM